MNKTAFKHDRPNDSAGFLLWQVTSLWKSELEKVFTSYGITQLQFAVLASLKWFEEQHQETTQAHIVEHAKIDKMTVSRALRKLEKLGWVARERSNNDGRALGIGLTEQGKDKVNQAIVDVEAADDRFFAGLTEQNLTAYKDLTVLLIQSRMQL